MRLGSREIPQADRLDTVLEVVVAVAGGATTYQAIADAIGLVERQGRYYRLAAELLGLIERVSPNTYHLTKTGVQFINADEGERTRILADCVLELALIQRIMVFLESRRKIGCSREELVSFLGSVAQPTGQSMIPRRTSTAVAWLVRIGVVVKMDGRYYLGQLPEDVGVIKYASNVEPLLPRRFDLTEYKAPQARIASRGGDIVSVVDAALRERANSAHQTLVDIVASRLRAAGALPRNNSYVDLAAVVNGVPYIFEMKSCTSDNMRDQIRRGVSQLYEYQYLQAVENARLVLVVEKPLTRELSWMADYLVKDRGIGFAWDGDGATLHCDAGQRPQLAFLV